MSPKHTRHNHRWAHVCAEECSRNRPWPGGQPGDHWWALTGGRRQAWRKGLTQQEPAWLPWAASPPASAVPSRWGLRPQCQPENQSPKHKGREGGGEGSGAPDRSKCRTEPLQGAVLGSSAGAGRSLSRRPGRRAGAPAPRLPAVGQGGDSLRVSETEGLDAVRRRGPAHPDLLVPVGGEDVAVVGTHGLRPGVRRDRPAGEDPLAARHQVSSHARRLHQPSASSPGSPSSPSSVCPRGHPVTKSRRLFPRGPLPRCSPP